MTIEAQRPLPHPDFDGHLERPPAAMTPAEKLAWIDEMRAWFEIGRRHRERLARPSDASPDASPDRPTG